MANEGFVILCPFASRVPYEMWVLPRRHASHFDRARDEVIEDTGRIVHEMLTRLSHLIEYVPYNFLLHTAPFDTSDEPYYHWHIEIIPRITREAGFEWGTGCHINPLFPEQAASRLRCV
jgi:UDPglucose--hexose-1-phosphate uridylyltransferase